MWRKALEPKVLASSTARLRTHVSKHPALLNDRTAQLIGQVVTVVVAIENGEGRVRVGDSEWSARGGPAVRQDPYIAPWIGIEGDDRQALALADRLAEKTADLFVLARSGAGERPRLEHRVIEGDAGLSV